MADSATHRVVVTLLDVEPPVWRELLVPGTFSLAKLHRVIQVAMGWQDAHLHLFEIDGVGYGQPDPEDDDLVDQDETGTTVAEVAGREAIYTYDFGDSWDHVLEIHAAPEGDAAAATCVNGARACPPEDSGGSDGYDYLLEALGDPSHEEHQMMLDWLGGPFDPERFDREAVNRKLAAIR